MTNPSPTVHHVLWSTFTEVSATQYHVEASTLGLKPGEWPDYIKAEGERASLSFARPTHATPEVVIYTCGSVELHVIND